MREHPGSHASPLLMIASGCPPHLEERLLHEVLRRLTLAHHPVGQRVRGPAVTVVELRERLGVPTLSEGYQILVRQKQVWSPPVRHNQILRQSETLGPRTEDARPRGGC